MKNNIILTGTLTLLILGMGLSPVYAGPPPPPEGTLLTSFNALGSAWSATFDGTNLYTHSLGSSSIIAYQTDGTPLPGLNIVAGVPLSGAISWDPVRQVFWAGSNSPSSFNVYTVAKDGTTTLQFNTLTAMQNNGNCGGFCSSINDGIDYDPITDSIWYSPDGAKINYNFDTLGNLIGTLSVNVVPNNMVPECGNDFTSGIMGRGTTVYVIHHLCGAFKYDTSTIPPTKISFFPIPGQIEDAECDGVTFSSQGVDALWMGSSGSLVRAYAVPLGTCETISIGGELLPIDSTALLLAGAQTFSWMIPVVLSVLGIGLFVVSRKSE